MKEGSILRQEQTEYINFTAIMKGRGNLSFAVFLAGLLAGTLDIISAIILFYAKGGKDPLRLFQYIASGVFGKRAFSGGPAMALWGLVFHYAIAYIFTTIFFLFYPQVRKIIKSRIVAGLAYGVIVWVVMNRLVVPMSGVTIAPFNLLNAVINAVILMLMIGLPLSLSAHRFYYGRAKHGQQL